MLGASGNRARTNRRWTANYESGGQEFEISLGAPVYETSRANRTAFTRPRTPQTGNMLGRFRTLVSPSRTQSAGFPHWASQMPLTKFIASNCKIHVASKRQLELQAICSGKSLLYLDSVILMSPITWSRHYQIMNSSIV